MTYIPDKQAFGVYKMLFQMSPASPNTPESIFSPGADEEVHIITISLASHNNQDIDYKLYLDDDGTTYADSTLVHPGVVNRDEADPAGKILVFMNNSAGNLAFEADDIDCTLTAWGIVYDLS